MILHLSQIFLTDGLTFIVIIPYLSVLVFSPQYRVRHFSCVLSWFPLRGGRSFCSPGDTSLIEVVNRYLNRYAVTGKNSDIIHAELSGNMSCNDMLIRKLHLEGGIRQCLNDRTFKFNRVLRQNNPSVSVMELSENFCRCVRMCHPQASKSTHLRSLLRRYSRNGPTDCGQRFSPSIRPTAHIHQVRRY